jgi:hypothetical protein
VSRSLGSPKARGDEVRSFVGEGETARGTIRAALDKYDLSGGNPEGGSVEPRHVEDSSHGLQHRFV